MITWISIDTTLPDDEKLVIVAWGNGETGVAYLDDSFWYDGITMLITDDITHWSDLPEHPAFENSKIENA